MCETCGCNSPVKKIKIEQDLFSKNSSIADKNKLIFENYGIVVINMLSSPGAGKTTILEKTIMDLKNELKIAVIEGDQQTNRDALRINKTNVPVYQINTGSACHLDAGMVSHAMDKLPLDNLDIVFIENVGNLICPSEFELGEDFKVLVTSVTEGEDKAIKYPSTFMNTSLILINKTDLLKVLDFDLDESIYFIKKVNQKAAIVPISAKTGEGMDKWYSWIKEMSLEKRRNQNGCL